MFNDYDITNLKVKLKFAVQEDVYLKAVNHPANSSGLQ